MAGGGDKYFFFIFLYLDYARYSQGTQDPTWNNRQ